MDKFPAHLVVASLGALLLAGCATAPDAPRTSRTDAAEPVTGSNLPRRNRKAVGNVIVVGPEVLRDAQESGKAAPPPSN